MQSHWSTAVTIGWPFDPGRRDGKVLLRENVLVLVWCSPSRRLRTAIASALRITGIKLARLLRLVWMDPRALAVEIDLIPLESGRVT